MGLIGKLKSKILDKYCSRCQSELNVAAERLYALPDLSVGHYIRHEDAEYYKKHLVPIVQKSQVPAGMYACRATAYQCPQCGHRAVKLVVFLPVRDEEKMEQGLYFEKGEMDDFLFGMRNG
ncbi:MAG: hypothetical protein NC254_05630 [bacterium]|nr:hypothetical protein [bacterium]